MKLIEVAREQKDLLNEGIAYIAIWQETQANGRKSWFTDAFWGETEDENNVAFSTEDKTRLAEIVAKDGGAVLLNGYYHAWIGSADEPLNALTIERGLRKHYETGNALVRDYLAEPDETPAFEDLKLDEREELGLGQTRRRDPQGENGMSADDVPDTITIELPCPKEHQAILHDLLQSKATLIQTALGDDCAWGQEFGTDGYLCDLPIEFTDSTIKCEWLTFGADSDTIKAWSDFLCAAVKFAKKAKRVTAGDKPSANERFDFRVLCVKIGLNGAEYKETRKTLSRFLTGDAAFATPTSKAKWQAKHGARNIETAEALADAELIHQVNELLANAEVGGDE